jgi:hypothetical protein
MPAVVQQMVCLQAIVTTLVVAVEAMEVMAELVAIAGALIVPVAV